MQIPPEGTKKEQRFRADHTDKEHPTHVEDEYIHALGSRGRRVSVPPSYLKDTALL